MKAPSPLPQRPPRRQGINRLRHAFLHSLGSLSLALKEPAFRVELYVATALVPASFWVGHTAIERALLLAAVLFVLVLEVLNTAMEAAIDRIGEEHRVRSKASKGLGNAKVLLAVGLAFAIWWAIWWAIWFSH